MITPLRVLIVEDVVADVELIVHELRRAGFAPDWQHVQTEADYGAALDSRPEIILADYSLPQFPAPLALQLLQERGLDIPFIIVTGSVGEEAAVECIKRGAADSLLKDHLTRLGPAVIHALHEKRVREEKRQAEDALQRSEARFRSSFDYAASGMALVALDGRWLQVNQALCEIVGYPAPELLATTFPALAHSADLKAILDAMTQLFTSGLSHCQLEMRCLHKRGHEVWVLVNIATVYDPQRFPLYLIVQIQDITARKRAEEALRHEALHDTLTGLPNRALFLDRLEQALRRAKRRQGYHLAVLFLDLDRFKLINDSLGHLLGDQLLIAIAHRLGTVLRTTDTAARLGGDEFAILLEDFTAARDVNHVVERLQQDLALPFHLSGHEVFTTVSIGVTSNTGQYCRPEEMLRDADTAMYRAKALGRARAVVFMPEMHAHAVTRLQLETDLRRAVERQEFRLFYQPIVTLATGRIHGFEALVRWQHPTRGLLAPGEFLSVAEETGLILPLGWWVLEEACRQVQAWRQRFPAAQTLKVSVNLASRQFAHPELIERLDRVLREIHLVDISANLQLEITEHVLIDYLASIPTQLSSLKTRGIGISLDDFGTGYSSLSYLQRFAIDTLKIDRSFVSQLGKDDKSAAMVRMIVMLAHSLGMEVIAEGVETVEQLTHLRDLYCEYAQGYYFSPPIEAQAAERFIAVTPPWELRAVA